ncbi:MAG: hypothetical protein ABW321_00595 [Polyangiales bacterium]
MKIALPACAVLSCGFDSAPIRSLAGAPDAGASGGGSRSPTGVGSPSPSQSPQTPSATQPDAASPQAALDAGGLPEPPQMTPALQCGGAFCPLADAPAAACCTTPTDVERRMARRSDACGVNLSAFARPEYGPGCWQRDQLGLTDARCQPLGAEPGCCADDGSCGSFELAQQLGCRHAPGSEQIACGAEPPTDRCDPVGSYGLRLTVDAAWEGHDTGLASLTDDGRGPIQIYVLANVEGVDPATGQLSMSGRVCGVTLPPFYSTTLCESYQPIFPDAIWESQQLPRPVLEGRYECGTQGCVMSLSPTTVLFGIRLTNPEALWPSAADTRGLRCPDQPDEDCFPDDDADGLAGLSVLLPTEGVAAMSSDSCLMGYNINAAPLSASVGAIFGGVRRTNRLSVGIRARMGASVRFDTACRTATGSGIAQYVNSRATSCLLEPGSFDVVARNRPPAGLNERCSMAEATFIDESMPEYRPLGVGESPAESLTGRDDSPSPGPTVSVVRFDGPPADIACQQVRDAAYTPQP